MESETNASLFSVYPSAYTWPSRCLLNLLNKWMKEGRKEERKGGREEKVGNTEKCKGIREPGKRQDEWKSGLRKYLPSGKHELIHVSLCVCV